MGASRVPPAWTVDGIGAAFVVKDSAGQKPVAIQFSVTPITFPIVITR
jgi:hypothetical protein